MDVGKAEIPFISDNTISVSNTSFLQNGDVILADAAEDETVGKCSEIRAVKDSSIVSGLHTIPCRPINPFAFGYLGYYMNSSAYHDQLLPLIQGTKVSSVSKSSLLNTHILYPVLKEEQSQIGKYFHNLDNLITLHQRKPLSQARRSLKCQKNLITQKYSVTTMRNGLKYIKMAQSERKL